MPKNLQDTNDLTKQILLDKLKEHFDLAKNIDNSGKMINQQVALAGKQAINPKYIPSPNEQANRDNYFNNITNAVGGSINLGQIPISKELKTSALNKLKSLLGDTSSEVDPLVNRAQILNNKSKIIADDASNVATPSASQEDIDKYINNYSKQPDSQQILKELNPDLYNFHKTGEVTPGLMKQISSLEQNSNRLQNPGEQTTKILNNDVDSPTIKLDINNPSLSQPSKTLLLEPSQEDIDKYINNYPEQPDTQQVLKELNPDLYNFHKTGQVTPGLQNQFDSIGQDTSKFTNLRKVIGQ